MSENFNRLVISFIAGVAGTAVSAFITIGIVGYGFEKSEFALFAVLFISIGVITAWLTYRLRYKQSFEDLYIQYPNGVLEWVIEKKLIKDSSVPLQNISYKSKVEAVNSKADIIAKEQKIRDQFDKIKASTSISVFSLYAQKYKTNKYEIVRRKLEIEQAEFRHRKEEKEKKINTEYEQLKKKYPKGFPIFEKLYSDNGDSRIQKLSKEQIVGKEGEIKRLEEISETVSQYVKWEQRQRVFGNGCCNKAKEILPTFGRYFYDVNYVRINTYGEDSMCKFRIWQFFPVSICIERSINDLMQVPRLMFKSVSLPRYKNHERTFDEQTYNQIISFIKKLGDEKDILVYYNSESNGWTTEEQWQQLNPIISSDHNWLEYDPLSEEVRGIKTDDEYDALVNFKGKYIVVLDTMTENYHLKDLCKRIREVYPADAPLICYISLLKCYDSAEVEEQIQAEKERKLKIQQEKQKEEKAKKDLIEAVSSWDTLIGGLHYSYLFYYYPTTCEFEATEEEWQNRWIIWDFKNTPGKTSSSDHQKALGKAIPMLKDKLVSTFNSENLKYLTLVCLPASSQVKTAARYEEFSEKICSELGLINAYSHISVIKEKEEKHLGGSGTNINNLHFDETFFKGKYVLLFDDVITKGNTMRLFKSKMESLGAVVVGGLSLGKTKHERPNSPIITESPRIFKPKPFPPQPTYNNDDDLPF